MLQTMPSRTAWPKWAALAFWLLLLGVYQWYTITWGLTPWALLAQFLSLLRHPLYGPLLYVIFYALQPVIFFPSWLLTISGGYLYGVPLGVAYTLIGSNLSSLVAYGVGHFFGDGVLPAGHGDGAVARYAARMRKESFVTVLVMRFLFLPYDLVSYLAGFLHIRWGPFLLATMLGSIPGTLAFVSFGASIQGDFAGQRVGVDGRTLSLSLALFATSYLLWRYVKRRDIDP